MLTLSNETCYLSWKQAEVYSGLSIPTLRRLVRRGKIRAYQPSAKRTLLARADIDKHFENTQIHPEQGSME